MKLLDRVRGAIRGWREGEAGFYKDGLTGLLNIGFLEDGYLDHLMAEAIRYKYCLSVVIIDIDDFKRINDNLGHQAGDRVIIGLRDIMRNGLRRADWFIRYGGDEFLLILPKTSKENAKKMMSRIELIDVSISYGIADMEDIIELKGVNLGDSFEKEFTWRDLVRIADQRLLLQKEAKKKRVT
jgi:two-component system, cell cycle response regulator